MTQQDLDELKRLESQGREGDFFRLLIESAKALPRLMKEREMLAQGLADAIDLAREGWALVEERERIDEADLALRFKLLDEAIEYAEGP